MSEHEQADAFEMLQAGARVSDVAEYYNCHPTTLQRLRDRYQATGIVKDRRRYGQPRMTTDVKVAIYFDCISDICIDDMHSDRLPSVSDE